MFLTFLLSRLSRPVRFVWTPALDLSDHEVYSALIRHPVLTYSPPRSAPTAGLKACALPV